jgi:hypothetical protein
MSWPGCWWLCAGPGRACAFRRKGPGVSVQGGAVAPVSRWSGGDAAERASPPPNRHLPRSGQGSPPAAGLAPARPHRAPPDDAHEPPPGSAVLPPPSSTAPRTPPGSEADLPALPRCAQPPPPDRLVQGRPKRPAHSAPTSPTAQPPSAFMRPPRRRPGTPRSPPNAAPTDRAAPTPPSSPAAANRGHVALQHHRQTAHHLPVQPHQRPIHGQPLAALHHQPAHPASSWLWRSGRWYHDRKRSWTSC